MPNETPPELVEKILEMTARYPTYSYVRISQQLRLVGIGVSPPAVRGVWQRQGLTLRLPAAAVARAEDGRRGRRPHRNPPAAAARHRGELTDPQQHIEAPKPGYLLCQDTYFVGTIKGVGRIYLQRVVDANCSLASASCICRRCR